MKEELTERFKGYSTEQLIDILEFTAGYTNEAMEVARLELKSRNISELELEEIRKSLAEKKDLPANEFEKISRITEDKISSFTQSIKSFFQKEELVKAQNIVKLLLIVSWMLYLYHFFRYNVHFFIYNFSSIGEWDLYTLFFFFGELYTPIMLIFLALKFKSGWYMFFYNSLLIAFSSFLNLLLYYYYYVNIDGDDSLSELLNLMSPQRPYLQLYFNLLIASGMLWAVRLKQVKVHFGITKTGVIITIFVAIASVLLAIMYGMM